MKKKLLLIIAALLVVAGFIGLIIYNNRTVSTITLDINPSIEINLNKSNKVKSVIALNEDAKDVISKNIKGKSLNDTLNILASNIVEKGYTEDGMVTILLYSKGSVDNNDIQDILRNSFGSQNTATNIIVIDNISKEDIKLAEKYHISVAKAAYVNSIIKENDNLSIDYLINESIRGLNDTKNTGNYCDNGYSLEGDWCLKEIDRKKASNGKVCPDGYLDYEGVCYEEKPIEHTNKLICRDEFTLNGDKCIRRVSQNATAVKVTCTAGKEMTNYEAGLTEKDAGNANDIVCVDTSNATHPVSPCETHDGTEYTMAGGKCYWHRAPVIEAGCPGKLLVNGECWDDATGIYICEGNRDGKRYRSRDEYCEGSIKMVPPTVSEYKCQNGYTLEKDRCFKDEIEDPFYEEVCPGGYTKVNNDRCINKNETINKENGLVCEYENSKMKGNECIIYDIIEAKHD